MDTQLFMECEEEELEPWQQVDDSVEEEDVDFMDNCEPEEDSLSPLPASETPPIDTPSPLTPVTTAPSSVQTISIKASPPPTSLITSTSSLTTPTTLAATVPPLLAQAPPLILTQTAGGTFLLPAATGNASILLTAQGFPVMNHGAPLLLNLQPGQAVHPLTLIQSSSLGQLVRPNMGVSPVLTQGQVARLRQVPTPPLPLAQLGAAPPQLSATLGLRMSAPGSANVQVTPVAGLALQTSGGPASSPGSASGVGRKAVHSTAGSSPSVTTVASSSLPKVVMSVDDFYYGTFKGDLSVRKTQTLAVKTSAFKCVTCSYLAENNLRLMQHMLQHSGLVGEKGVEDRNFCRFCYRQFSSLSQLQNHQEQVHGPTQSACKSLLHTSATQWWLALGFIDVSLLVTCSSFTYRLP